MLDCLRRCCRCGRWMSSYKSNRAGSWCSLWGFRRCGLFAFVHICHHWKICLHSEVAATWCQIIVDIWCCHITVPYSDIFGLLLTKAQQSPSGTMQQSMKSQACFSVLFVLFVFDSRSKVLNKNFNLGGTQPTLLYDFTFSLCGVTQGNPAKHKLGARFAQGWRKRFHVLSWYISYTYNIYILSYIVCT